MRSIHSPRGFTLLDILMSMAIVAVLVGIAVPAFSTLIQTTKTRTVTQSLLGILNYARGEAVSHSTQVVICPMVDNECTGNWRDPLAVFIDNNRDEKINGEEKVLSVSNIIEKGESLNWRASGNTAYISFDETGGTGNQNGRLYYCDNAESPQARAQVIVYRTGRARLPRKSEIRDEC